LLRVDECDVELDVRRDKLEGSYTDREIASKPFAVCSLALRLSGAGGEWYDWKAATTLSMKKCS
jgi:hypothetical protein